jgi:hypothetical protein
VEAKPHIIFDHACDNALDSPFKFSGFPVVDPKSLSAGQCILRIAMTVAPDRPDDRRGVVVQLAGDILFKGPVQGEAVLGLRLSPEMGAQLPGALLQIEQDEPDSSPGLSLSALQLVRLPILQDRLSLKGVADMDARTVALQFESLGDNCEFGLFQRHVGAEPLGLLRFAGVRLDNLLIGLREGFRGFDDHGRIETYLFGDAERREYVTRQTDYAMVSHTGVFEGDMTQSEVHAREITRFRYLRRRFVEDLEDAQKIFVIRRDPPLSEPEVLPIWLALREYGPNSLLCVAPAKDGHPAGSVEVIAEGLMMGYVDRLAPYTNAHDVSDESWLELCRNVLIGHYSVAERTAPWKRLWPLDRGGHPKAPHRRAPVVGRR